ncbi:DNA polymerase III subunit delta' [Tepidibacillus marianensis]|uniref:DNA polymerase III subunit delta' n=1 Tax=Tepidibacillus marianensis TaxID=3131995 RepID=UPI0030CC4EAF
MSFNQVIGQQRITEQLTKSIQNQRVSHAYIFTGPKGVGKLRMALEVAKALNCEVNTGDACDHCLHCRRIDHHNHPDVIWVKPDKQSITIDQIRQLQQEFHYKAMDSKQKVYIIEQAETMTPVAANSLLKFIEEPHPSVTIILLAENLHVLLSTIRSRCQVLYFSSFNPNNLVKILQGEGLLEQEILIAAHLTNDQNEVREMVKSEVFAQMKSLMLQWIKELFSKSSQALLMIQERILKNEEIKAQLPRFLDLLIIWYRDILNIKLNRQDVIVFKEYIDLLENQGLELNEDQLLKNIEQILETKRRIASHVQPQLALEQLALLLQEG